MHDLIDAIVWIIYGGVTSIVIAGSLGLIVALAPTAPIALITFFGLVALRAQSNERPWRPFGRPIENDVRDETS